MQRARTLAEAPSAVTRPCRRPGRAAAVRRPRGRAPRQTASGLLPRASVTNGSAPRSSRWRTNTRSSRRTATSSGVSPSGPRALRLAPRCSRKVRAKPVARSVLARARAAARRRRWACRAGEEGRHLGAAVDERGLHRVVPSSARSGSAPAFSSSSTTPRGRPPRRSEAGCGRRPAATARRCPRRCGA